MARVRGTVKWFDPEKGWGFIRLETGDEVFVHHSDIRGDGFRSLRDGAAVDLEVERADRGPRARDVRPAGDEAADLEAGAGAAGPGRKEGGRERSGARPDRNRGEAAAAPQAGPAGTRTLDEQVRERLGSRYGFTR